MSRPREVPVDNGSSWLRISNGVVERRNRGSDWWRPLLSPSASQALAGLVTYPTEANEGAGDAVLAGDVQWLKDETWLARERASDLMRETENARGHARQVLLQQAKDCTAEADRLARILAAIAATVGGAGR